MALLKRPESTRYNGLQALRVIACLSVLFFHITLDGKNSGTLPLPIWYGGMSGVDIFFVLSGFVMLHSADRVALRADGWKTFLLHRVLRIVPMYWFFTLVFLLLGAGLSATALHRSYFVRWVVGSFLFWPTRRFPGDAIVSVCPVGWTLVFEMFFYLVVTVALALRRNLLLICCVAMLTMAALSARRTLAWGNVGFFFDPIVLEFALGMVVYRLHSRGKDLPRWLAWPLLLAGLVVLATTYLPERRYFSYGLPAGLIVASTVALEETFRKTPAWVLFLADATYVLYLLHVGTNAVVLLYLVRGFRNPVLLVFACIALALGCASIVHRLLERPVQRWLLKRFAPAKGPSALPRTVQQGAGAEG